MHKNRTGGGRILGSAPAPPVLSRLFSNSIPGPSAATAYSGNFISGMVFTVQKGGCWMQGYWWWVCPTGGQNTGPTKCALWNNSYSNGSANNGAQAVVPGSIVTSGALVSGWNYIPLATPIPLAIGGSYIAAIGCNGPFPDTPTGWGTTYPQGLTSGPLYAYGPAGTSYYAGGYADPNNSPQGCFNASGTADPSVTYPGAASSTDNFWVDVQISNQPPSGYSGSYRMWPNLLQTDPSTGIDSAVNYIVGTEFWLSRPCIINKLWFYSPSTSPNFPTSADVWSVTGGGLTGMNLLQAPSPTWLTPSNAPAVVGSGQWVYVAFGTSLPAGRYRATAYDANGTVGGWSAKRLGYWGLASGMNAQGVIAPSNLVNGPLTFPTTSNSDLCYSYQNESVGGIPTPTYTEPGQSVFQMDYEYPNLYVGTNSPGGNIYQNYWVDVEVT